MPTGSNSSLFGDVLYLRVLYQHTLLQHGGVFIGLHYRKPNSFVEELRRQAVSSLLHTGVSFSRPSAYSLPLYFNNDVPEFLH